MAWPMTRSPRQIQRRDREGRILRDCRSRGGELKVPPEEAAEGVLCQSGRTQNG